jgi:hypothetical protein
VHGLGRWDGIDELLQFMVDGPEFRVEGQDCVVRLGRYEEGSALQSLVEILWANFVASSSSFPFVT